MKKLFLLLILLLPLSLSAQNLYLKNSFIGKSGEVLQYRSLSPENVVEGEKYPLVVFMHGAGERGEDNEIQLKHGSQMFLNPSNRENFPAYVIFPQCPTEKYWAYDKRPDNLKVEGMPFGENASTQIQLVYELISQYLDMESVDSDRVYVIGLSMGGMATYDMVSRYGDLFSAAVPICGISNIENLAKASHVPFWIFHGDADPVVPVDGSRAAYRRLRECGAEPRYTEFAGCDHQSWNLAFNYPGFMEWLFAQKR